MDAVKVYEHTRQINFVVSITIKTVLDEGCVEWAGKGHGCFLKILVDLPLRQCPYPFALVNEKLEAFFPGSSFRTTKSCCFECMQYARLNEGVEKVQTWRPSQS